MHALKKPLVTPGRLKKLLLVDYPTTEMYLQSLGDSERQAMAMFEEASRNSHTKSHTAVVSSDGRGS